MDLKFIKEPFIPEKSVKLVLIDGRTPKNIVETLSSFGIDLILTTQCTSVYDSISFHPDIQVHPLGDGTFAVCPELFPYFSQKLSPYGFKIICGNTRPKSNYPGDIAYNVARIGALCFHNFKNTEPIIKKYFIEKNFNMINVNQGYSKCSIAVVSKSAIITSDNGIHFAALEQGLNSLLISPGHIRLEGQTYGFIGGCTGLIAPDVLAVTGSLKEHPDYLSIKAFLREQKVDLLFLSDGIPVDLGSLIPILEANV